MRIGERRTRNILGRQWCPQRCSSVQLKCIGTWWRTGGEVKGKLRIKCVASTLRTTSEHGVSRITTADAHTSAASSRLNWRPRRFKRTRPFRRKKKSGFCACAITFQTQSTKRRHALPLFLVFFSEHCSMSIRPHTRMFLAGVGETRKDSGFMGTPPRGWVLNQNTDWASAKCLLTGVTAIECSSPGRDLTLYFYP